MTKKLYYENAYQKQFEGIVTACNAIADGYEVILDQTAFYPEGGGQPSDTGFICTEDGTKVNVTYVSDQGEEICHRTDKEVAVGSKVTGTIDWKRRYHFMQQHSGEHILSGLIHEMFGYDNVGFHMGSDVVTVDFSGVIPNEKLAELESKANEIVYENTETNILYPTEEELETIDYRSKKELSGQVRIVSFDHADICACCGTHVKRTGEIGVIKVLSSMNYKGGTRFFMLSGEEAYEDYVKKNDILLSLSRKLSSKPELVAEAVDKLQTELKDQKEQMNGLYEQLFLLKAKEVSEGKALLFEENLNMKQIRDFVNLLAEKCEFAMVCAKTEENTYQFVAAAKTIQLKEVSKQLNSALDGKGGGNDKMIQGTLHGSEDRIRETVFSLI